MGLYKEPKDKKKSPEEEEALKGASKNRKPKNKDK